MKNVFTCESVSLGYDIKHKGILRTLGMERLRVNAYMNDIMRLSTVRQERVLIIRLPIELRFL